MSLRIVHIPQEGYEDVVSFSDDTGFQCFIALHSTALGPAIGGCRIKPYASPDDAMQDVMRLAKGMTYKSSLAGLDFGGGKCVVVADRATDEVMRKVGEAVEYFDGAYITAEDVGTTLADIEVAAQMTQHVVHQDGSPLTARGVYACIEAAVKWQGEWGDSLNAVSVWVQGLGKVGMDVARRLQAVGSDLYVSDIRPDAVAEAVQFGAEELGATDSKFIAVYSPCAMGQVVTATNVHKANSIICGAANNQLADENLAEVLAQHGVLFCPDYLVNAGGVICAACEIGQPYDEARAEAETDGLAERLVKVLDLAEQAGVTPLAAANMLAEARL